MTIGLPSTLPPKSSAAIWAAMTEPGPARSEYAPVMSVSAPTFTTPSEICATAEPAAQQASAAARAARDRFRSIRDIGPPPFRWVFRRATGLDAEESVERLRAPLQSFFRDHVDDAAVLDQVVAVPQRRGEAGNLLPRSS